MWNIEKKEVYSSWDEYLKHLADKKLFGIPGLDDKIQEEKKKDKFLEELLEEQLVK